MKNSMCNEIEKKKEWQFLISRFLAPEEQANGEEGRGTERRRTPVGVAR